MKAAHLEEKAVSHDLRQACPFCGGDVFRTVLRTYRTTYILSHAYPLEYQYCRACGLVYSARRLSAAQLDYLYHSGREVDPASFAKGHAWRSPTDRVRAEFLQHVLAEQAPHLQGGGCLLEIGSGYGAFLKHAKASGFQATGIESSPSRAECTRRQVEAEVMTGTFPQAAPSDRRYDVVCAFHVIEHIQDPLPFLAQARAALVEGGALYLETPNILAIQQRQLAESHTILYSPRTLAALVRRAGFRVLYLDDRAKSVFDTDDQLRVIAVKEERAGGAVDIGRGALEEIDAEEAVRTAIRKSLQTMYPEGGRVTVVKRMQGLITSGSRWAVILGPLVCIGMLVGRKRAWMEKLITGLGGAIDPGRPLNRPALAWRAYRLLVQENAEIRKNRLYYESLADGFTASHETSACVTR